MINRLMNAWADNSQYCITVFLTLVYFGGFLFNKIDHSDLGFIVVLLWLMHISDKKNKI